MTKNAKIFGLEYSSSVHSAGGYCGSQWIKLLYRMFRKMLDSPTGIIFDEYR